MPRARDPNRDRAYEIWRNHDGNITNRQIAEELGVNEKVVAVWKQRDKWNVVQQSDSNVVQQTKKNKGGAPKGNQNAKGNRGGAPPTQNKNAEKHGFFSKYMPPDTLAIMQEIETRQPIDMLWDQITIQYAAILRAQQIMYVRDQQDQTKVIKKGMDIGTEYDIQYAWDKHATFLQAQSRAMGELRSLIKQYEDMCRQGEVDEEKKLRIAKLKLEVKDLRGDSDGDAHAQGSGYAEALNAQAADVFADEVNHGEET